MKRFTVVLAAALMSIGALRAYEFPGFEWTVGADFATAYMWRGLNFGGVCLQPDVMVGYGGAKLEAWANLSPEDNTFKGFAPELDITLSYTFSLLTVGVTHQYYFDGTKYFDYKKPSVITVEGELDLDDHAGNQTEVFGKLEFGEIWEKFPLTFMWSTYVGGDDWYLTDEGKVKKAYSSYFEFSYDADLGHNLTLTPTIGMTPWKSMYNFYEGKFAVNNIGLKLNWELEILDHFCIDVYAQTSLNTYGLNKHNLFATTSNSYSADNTARHWNAAVGIGIWFY